MAAVCIPGSQSYEGEVLILQIGFWNKQAMESIWHPLWQLYSSYRLAFKCEGIIHDEEAHVNLGIMDIREQVSIIFTCAEGWNDHAGLASVHSAQKLVLPCVNQDTAVTFPFNYAIRNGCQLGPRRRKGGYMQVESMLDTMGTEYVASALQWKNA